MFLPLVTSLKKSKHRLSGAQWLYSSGLGTVHHTGRVPHLDLVRSHSEQYTLSTGSSFPLSSSYSCRCLSCSAGHKFAVPTKGNGGPEAGWSWWPQQVFDPVLVIWVPVPLQAYSEGLFLMGKIKGTSLFQITNTLFYGGNK